MPHQLAADEGVIPAPATRGRLEWCRRRWGFPDVMSLRILLPAVLAGGLLLVACGGAPPAPAPGAAAAVTVPEPAAGPPPALPVDAGSASSPLPDLAVRRINGAGGWVNLRNELPADRPLLVWFWAPH